MDSRKIVRFVLLGVMLCLCGMMCACATAGNDSLRKETEASVNDKIKPGETTKAEVKSMFGSPLNTSFTDSGQEIWKYELSNVSADATSFIPVVSIFAASSSGKKKELVVFFDDKDVVKKFNMSESAVKMRHGLLNQ